MNPTTFLTALPVMVLGVVALAFALGLLSARNYAAGIAIGAIGLVLVVGMPVWSYFFNNGLPVWSHEASRLRQLQAACAQVPATIDGARLHQYVGTVVDPPGPGPLGAIGQQGPDHASLFVHIDRSTTVATAGGVVLAVTAYDGPPVALGSRVAFCGHAAAPTYWWPQTGHHDGKAIYGEPRGPYRAVRWVMDMNANEPTRNIGGGNS